jgi:hypothetical protein
MSEWSELNERILTEMQIITISTPMMVLENMKKRLWLLV